MVGPSHLCRKREEMSNSRTGRSGVVILMCVALVSMMTWVILWPICVRSSWDKGINSVKEPPPLQTILHEVDMGNKTVIITTLNQAWAAPNSMLDLFLESFRSGEGTSRFLNHLVIVALDQKAYDRCISIHSHCFILKTEGIDFSGEKLFMSDDYLKMMWTRIDFLRTVLQMGYNFVFTDVDILWFRNPFMNLATDTDFQIACDVYNGSPTDLNNIANGGFKYVKSNNRTIQFYKYWYSSHELYPGKHDQDVLNYIKHENEMRKIGLTMRFLDTTYFDGFCEARKDLGKICTMHANCCIGLDNKLRGLRQILRDWRKFQSLRNQERML